MDLKFKKRVKTGYKSLNHLNHELLTAEEELDLINRYQKHGDKSARDRLIECNLRLVPYVLKGFRSIASMPPFEDLVQEGNMGLLKAVDKFDPATKNRFATYAVWWIRAQAWLYMGANATVVNISRKKFQELCRAHREGRDRLTGNGSEATETEYTVRVSGGLRGRSVGDSMECEQQESTELLKAGLSLDAPFSLQDPVESGRLGDKLTYDSEGAVDRAIDLRYQSRLVDEAIERLPARDRWVIVERYKKGKTLQEVGESLELSRERIRQLETRAFNQIRKYVKRKSVCHSIQETRA